MSLADAVNDLVQTLDSSTVLDTVEDYRPMAGRPDLHLGITLGIQQEDHQFGRNDYRQQLFLTLTVGAEMSPAVVAEILKKIDTEIIADRRRNGEAQTTLLDEEGWTPQETELDSGAVITRTVEVHYYES